VLYVPGLLLHHFLVCRRDGLVVCVGLFEGMGIGLVPGVECGLVDPSRTAVEAVQVDGRFEEEEVNKGELSEDKGWFWVPIDVLEGLFDILPIVEASFVGRDCRLIVLLFAHLDCSVDIFYYFEHGLALIGKVNFK
jgi:hypothetical protein